MSFSRVPNFSFTSVKSACKRRSFALDTWARPLSLLVRETQRSSPVSFSSAATSFSLSPNASLTRARGLLVAMVPSLVSRGARDDPRGRGRT